MMTYKDEYFPAAVDVTLMSGTVSESVIASYFKIPTSRAKAIIQEMECTGVIGCNHEILITKSEWDEAKQSFIHSNPIQVNDSRIFANQKTKEIRTKEKAGLVIGIIAVVFAIAAAIIAVVAL